MKKLQHGKIYTQQEILDSKNKKIIFKYSMTPESAALANEMRLLSSYCGSRRRAVQLIKNHPNKYKELAKFIQTNNGYYSPQWNAYLYLQEPSGEFLKNVDFYCARNEIKTLNNKRFIEVFTKHEIFTIYENGKIQNQKYYTKNKTKDSKNKRI